MLLETLFNSEINDPAWLSPKIMNDGSLFVWPILHALETELFLVKFSMHPVPALEHSSTYLDILAESGDLCINPLVYFPEKPNVIKRIEPMIEKVNIFFLLKVILFLNGTSTNRQLRYASAIDNTDNKSQ
jgi:hypothetical protein